MANVRRNGLTLLTPAAVEGPETDKTLRVSYLFTDSEVIREEPGKANEGRQNQSLISHQLT